MMAELSDPILITRPAALRRLADELSQEKTLAVDTESNSLYAYQEQVCLIQFSTRKNDFLVDPLSLEDLSLLAPIFEDPNIEKIFHAAEYDIYCLKRDFNFEFNNLFDTMVAARILGRDAFGLGSILEQEFGVHLEKRYQRANWGQRPLPQHLLAYARLDTHYLIPLRNILYKELQEQDLLPLAEEDFERMTELTLNGRDVEDETAQCWRVSGSYDLEPQQAAVLMELCRYRDKVARAQNRPLFKVINDRTLIEIAKQLPNNEHELSQIKGMSRGQMRRHASGLLAAVQRGLRAKPAYPPRPPRPDDAFLERVDTLRRWRKHTAQAMGVNSDVVLPRDLLYKIAERHPQRMGELAQVLREVPWRLEHFGQDILNVLDGKNGP